MADKPTGMTTPVRTNPENGKPLLLIDGEPIDHPVTGNALWYDPEKVLQHPPSNAPSPNPDAS